MRCEENFLDSGHYYLYKGDELTEEPTMTAAPPTQTDLKSTLEELRASVAAEGARGLKGAMQQAFLGLLSVLLAILEDFRAGRLARIAPAAEPGDGADGAVADPSPRLSPAGGESPIQIADRWSSCADIGEGVAAGETRGAAVTRAETAPRPPAARTRPPGSIPGSGPRTAASLPPLRASSRPPRLGMIARLRRCAGWR